MPRITAAQLILCCSHHLSCSSLEGAFGRTLCFLSRQSDGSAL